MLNSPKKIYIAAHRGIPVFRLLGGVYSEILRRLKRGIWDFILRYYITSKFNTINYLEQITKIFTGVSVKQFGIKYVFARETQKDEANSKINRMEITSS